MTFALFAYVRFHIERIESAPLFSTRLAALEWAQTHRAELPHHFCVAYADAAHRQYEVSK